MLGNPLNTSQNHLAFYDIIDLAPNYLNSEIQLKPKKSKSNFNFYISNFKYISLKDKY